MVLWYSLIYITLDNATALWYQISPTALEAPDYWLTPPPEVGGK